MEATRKKTVMVIEDDEETADLLQSLLNDSKDFACIGKCLRLETGLRKACHFQPAIILFDLVHQKQICYSSIIELRSIAPTSILLVLTAYEDPDYIFWALRAGADGYLFKTDSQKDIVSRLNEVLESGPLLSPGVRRQILVYFRQQGTLVRSTTLRILSQAEIETLESVAEGYSNKEIATKMGLTVDAMKKRMRSIMEKLRVRNRTEAAALFNKIL
jgi:DNA-binding NarL/FixJ family response regulator